jgi:hypothetical protein
MDEQSSIRKSRFSEILITQIIAMVIILISVLIIKYFFKSTYEDLKAWYKEDICANTDIQEVLE